MKLSEEAEKILTQLAKQPTKLGDLRNIAKGIKKDHKLAQELWLTKNFYARLLAILVMDKKLLTEDVISDLINDIDQHEQAEKLQLIDWLMANQLTKDKNNIGLIESWKNNPSSLKRRVYWYHQARLRWVGQPPPPNSAELISEIENKIEKEPEEVQWAMNFTAAWIGVFEKKYRSSCVALGERTGLYKGEMVSKGCTPNYLPDFIAIESKKRNL